MSTQPSVVEGSDDEDTRLVPGHPQEDISAVVDEAAKGDISLYEQAMDYFLDDENDVEHIPLEEDITIKRMIEGVETDVFTGRIRTLSEDEIEQCRDRAEQDAKNGNRGEKEMDEFRFYTLLATTALVQPNLRDKRILGKFKTPERALQKRLLPGERLALGSFIMDRSGFGNSVVSAKKDDQKSRATKEFEAAKN